VPFILTGLRLGVGRGLVGVVVGEMVAAQAGIGFMLSRAGATFQTDKVFVGVVILALFGWGLTALLEALERRFDGWRPGAQR
jgi:NitT/TauT family transport system permease protein